MKKQITELTEKINKQNDFLDTHLNITKLKQKHNYDMIYKICDTVLNKYKINFSINPTTINLKFYRKYLKDLSIFIENNILNKETLELKDILALHYNIIKKLTTTEKLKPNQIWTFRNSQKYINWLTLDYKRKRIGFTHPKFLEKKEKILIEELNNSSKENKLYFILKFILSNLVILHPFENWNWKTFFILLDILLWKNNYFPCFLKDKRFELDLEKLFQIYTTNQNLEKLIEHFLKKILNIYKNYKM